VSEQALFPASDAGGVDVRHPDTPRLGWDPDDCLRTAMLSDNGLYRWTLHRRFGSGGVLRFIMLNPSTADAMKDDPTIVKCCGFAVRLGFGAIDVVNLFPFRATDPKVLWQAQRDGVDIGGGSTGRKHLAHALDDDEGGLTIAAWGANVRNDHERVRWLLDQPGAERLHCLSKTKRGEPGHPLMLPYSCLAIPWHPNATHPAAHTLHETEESE
jgi:hypothetical protein